MNKLENKNTFNKIVSNTENEIVRLIKLKNNKLGHFYDVRVNKNKIFCNSDIELAKLVTIFFPNKSIKILELGGGICQLTILLYNLGYKNISPNEKGDGVLGVERINCLNYLCNKLNIPIKKEYMGQDFFNIDDIDKFDLIITQNLKWKRSSNIQRYNEFLFYKKIIENGGIILYGDLCDTNFIDNEIKKYSNIEFYFYPKYELQLLCKKKFKYDSLRCILYYETISFLNIYDELLNINNENIIKLEFKEEISCSAGIFIPIFYILPYINITKINKYKLSFDIKIETLNKNSKIKIYTGIKWVTCNTELTKEYQTIEFEDNFNLSNRSIYRIGFINMENNILYLKNFLLNPSK